ncbi:DNA methyltransferase family protein [Chitinophaga agri]|uniref:Uncharacterized protein n=1 Tax=Chitinophaga agri TaxID=2703787 RepID=A0A6B9ZEN8_9BACT|nr:hypothetical protein [Chitinophaga agri]QHS60838.1 hypothetical protein GWR21_14905 [Chitinophaga agri]
MITAQQIRIIIHGNVQVYNTAPEHAAAFPYTQDELLGEVTRQKPEISFNTTRTDANGRKLPDGIEIRFGSARPTEATRKILRDHKFQFSERQTMWYAKDNALSRALAEKWANEEVEIDTTQYIKQHFWARIRSEKEYNQLRDYTEFFVKSEPPKNFNTKKALELTAIVNNLISGGILYFKKFFNKPVEEDEIQENDTSPPDGSIIADRLQVLADGMQKSIDEKFNSATSRQRPTHRRNRIVEGLEAEGRILRDTQKVLYALANAHRSGNISKFPLLENIRTKSQVGMLNLLERAIRGDWRENWAQETFVNRIEEFNRIGIDTFADWGTAEEQKQVLLKDSLSVNYQEEENVQRTRELERQVWGRDIPGFFPTPRPLVERMITIGELQANHYILDPSAGKGDILDVVRDKFNGEGLSYYAVEINKDLTAILRDKGYGVKESDFLQLKPASPLFDRILMNPPFENGKDADHVIHALTFLKPGGRLVAIVGEGLFFRKFKKEKSFRELLRTKNAYVSEPIEEAFRNAFNSTGVRVRLIAINEDGSPFYLHSADWQRPGIDAQDDDSMEQINTLELEAQAELELLRMRVESERRKRQRGISGVPVYEEKLRYLRQRALALRDKQEVSDFN